MENFQQLIITLKKFADDNIEGVSTNIKDILELSQRNNVLSIVEFVNDTPTALRKWEKNKKTHLMRIKACYELFQMLEFEAIPYAVIKGAYLDKCAYKNKGLRSSSDIDILIDKQNYQKVNDLLYQNGFICGEWSKKEQQINEYSRETILYNYLFTHQSASYVKCVRYRGDEYVIEVDINFSISWGEDIVGTSLTRKILEETQIIEYEGFRYRVLNSELYLLQLCLHSYRDMNSIILLSEGSFKLRLLCDVYYYITYAQNLDIKKFIDLCITYKYEKYVYYIFYYVTTLFGNVPSISDVMAQIKPNDEKYLNCFGLTENEYKQWNINLIERFTCKDLYLKIKELLNEADIYKIESIKNNM